MTDINASERGRAAANSNKTKQPMNDARFVKLLYAVVEESEDSSRSVKSTYITEWKRGWDEAKSEKKVQAEPTKKKTKKKAKRKAKK